MITNLDRKADLDDVLAEIAAAAVPPSAKALRIWTNKYPEFASAIIDFVTDWIATDALRSAHAASADEVDLVVNRTMSRVQMMLDEAERSAELSDLVADMSKVGHDLDSFQRAIGLDRTLVDSLVSRVIKPSTMPAEIVQRMASTLRRQVDTVRTYLRLEPQLLAAYKSRRQPTVHQVDFSYLVKHAQLPDDEKARLLAHLQD
jgi:hypothetical protein